MQNGTSVPDDAGRDVVVMAVGSNETAHRDIAESFQVPGSWRFTPEVADSFDSHVQASIPLYENIQHLVGSLADWLGPKGAVVADLGASTGTTAHLISSRHPDRGLTFHLYDTQRRMLDVAREKLGKSSGNLHFHIMGVEAGMAHADANLTLSLFTLQFLDRADRLRVLRMAHERSRPDGALILAEKLRLADSQWQEIAIGSTQDYKFAKGLSADAIYLKDRSLRGVLNPISESTYQTMLKEAGWTSVETLFRWHQWAILGAFASARE